MALHLSYKLTGTPRNIRPGPKVLCTKFALDHLELPGTPPLI